MVEFFAVAAGVTFFCGGGTAASDFGLPAIPLTSDFHRATVSLARSATTLFECCLSLFTAIPTLVSYKKIKLVSDAVP